MSEKTMRYILLSLALVSAEAYATLPKSASPICPQLDKLQCSPYFHNCEQDASIYCSGTWSAINILSKLFATRTDVDCLAKPIKWLPDASEVVNSYQVRCVYELLDSQNVTYQITLYNEKGYTLVNDKLIPTTNKD